MSSSRALDCPDVIHVTAVAPFVVRAGRETETVEAYVTVWISGPRGPGRVHVQFSRSLAQAEQLIAELRTAIEAAKALPLHVDEEG